MSECSFTKEESASIKGLLIFLIVLGHNFVFLDCFPSTYPYWYTFHVACFFILSYTYPCKKLTKKRIANYFARMYSPYFCGFIFLFVINVLCQKNGIVLSRTDNVGTICFHGFLLTLLNGGVDNLPTYVVFQYLWFLPVMFSFCILKDYMGVTTKKMRNIILAFGALFFVLLYVFMYNAPYPMKINSILEFFSVCSIFQALAFIFLSHMVIRFLRIIPNKWFALLGFVLVTIFYFNYQTIESGWILRICMPFLFFAMLVGFKKQLSKLSLLKAIGKISLPIYLVQTPICAIVYILAQYFLKVEGIWIALSSQILIFCLSFCVACLLTKTPYIRNLLFPREWNSILKR